MRENVLHWFSHVYKRLKITTRKIEGVKILRSLKGEEAG